MQGIRAKEGDVNARLVTQQHVSRPLLGNKEHGILMVNSTHDSLYEPSVGPRS